jgi:hypothetical protein
MEKKSLGRGLDDIADIFLSGIEEEPKKIFRGLSSDKIRNESCSACIHLIFSNALEPKCRIFTFDNEKHGVPYMPTITLTNGNYCDYFESGDPSKTDEQASKKNKATDPPDIEYEVEEFVKFNRKIAYSNNENTQKSIRKILLEHLEEGYEIRSIELKKTDAMASPRRKDTRDVEVTIFVKET